MSTSLEAELLPKLNDDFYESLLKYVDQVLMETSPKEQSCLLSHDLSALQPTEKPLYDVIAPDKMLGANGTLRSNSNLAFHGNYQPPVPIFY